MAVVALDALVREPTLETFDRRSDEISPTLHSVAKDRTAAAHILHSPTVVHDSLIS